MATATILQLPQVVGATGAELLEAVQSGTSVRMTSAQIAGLAAVIVATGPVGVAAAVPATGANNNYTASGQMGLTIGFMDLTPAGTCNITGVMSGFDGQILIVTNLSAFVITLNALNAGSSSANQFRMPGDFGLAQNASKTFKYSLTIGKWVAL